MKTIITLAKKCQEDGIILLAHELAFNLVLSLFPFLIFLLSVLAYLNIDGSALLAGLSAYIPTAILNIAEVLITEILGRRNAAILSVSLLFAVYNSSRGLRAIMRGINKSYGSEDTRNIVVIHLISVVLMLLLVICIILSLVVLIYGDFIIRLLTQAVRLNQHQIRFLNLFSFLLMLMLLTAMVSTVYKLGSCKKIAWREVLPGAATTVFFWITASKLFNIYVYHFAVYSRIYGSIAYVYVLLVWLNIISLVILIGSEINALLKPRGADNGIAPSTIGL